jgi:hypothetical protein
MLRPLEADPGKYALVVTGRVDWAHDRFDQKTRAVHSLDNPLSPALKPRSENHIYIRVSFKRYGCSRSVLLAGSGSKKQAVDSNSSGPLERDIPTGHRRFKNRDTSDRACSKFGSVLPPSHHFGDEQSITLFCSDASRRSRRNRELRLSELA